MTARNRLIDVLAGQEPDPQNTADAPNLRNKLLDVLLAGYRGANAAAGTADYYTGGLLSSLAGLNPFVGMDNAKAASASAQQDAAQMFGRDALAGAELPMLGIFAGPMARTANRVALKRAEELAAAGAPREQIWKDTGWFKGVDGKWRWEIDDTGLKAGVGAGKLSHPELQAAYGEHQKPRMPLTEVSRSLMPGGGYIPSPPHAQEIAPSLIVAGPTDGFRRKMAAHELQHHVQDVEGFGRGSNPLEFGVWGFSGTPFSWVPMSSIRKYEATSGEVEARAAEKRLNMTREQRKARPPWLDYDVPEDRQIVRNR